MNISIRFCISQFRSVFPKFRKVFTPWGIFKREIVTWCTRIYTSDYIARTVESQS